MPDEGWRPLGVETDEAIAEYDALHDNVPAWMSSAFWAWVEARITEYRRYHDGSGSVAHLREDLTERLAQTLQIALPNLRFSGTDSAAGRKQLAGAMKGLQGHKGWLQIADYLLAHSRSPDADTFESLLERSRSAWRVGTRFGAPGLVRRVPVGVQAGADAVMARSGRAGSRLAKAWGHLYGLEPSASEAYRLAILAAEDSMIPVISPSNKSATLGTVLRQLEDQGDWALPMYREHSNAPSTDVVIAMARLLWHGQHDRHGGQPMAPGNVSPEEAIVAVGIATTLIHWFAAGIVNRKSK